MNPFSEKEKKFSLCVPCYKETYLCFPKYFECLNNQEYTNFELIVCFDGKSRSGEKMLDTLKKKYPDLDVSCYTIKHKGACAARNEAVRHATGDFYAFPSPDIYLYPEALRMWANEFEDESINRVWGYYDILDQHGELLSPIAQAPIGADGEVWYPAFKFSPYCDGTFPVRKEAYIEWDEDCYSLNDWEYSLRLLAPTFEGKDWKYVHHSFFSAEYPKTGGLSDDSHKNWMKREAYVKNKNGIKNNDMVVSSLGAPTHAFNVSEILDCDYLKMPSFKDNDYKLVYLLGFYTKEDPSSPGVTKTHMDIFVRSKGKNVIHWIGTDIFQLRWTCSFEKIKELKKWFKDNKIIHLCEADFTQKELKELGIKAKVVPIPPKKLYKRLDLPDKFTVGIYAPKSEFYNESLMMEVIRCCPDIQFYLFGNDEVKGQKGDNWEHLGYIDYDEWIPKFSCNLRVTTHDGLPLTPLQFLTAGRNVVSNVPLKGAIRCGKDRVSIVKGLRKAQNSPLSLQVSKYWTKELDYDKYRKAIRGLK